MRRYSWPCCPTQKRRIENGAPSATASAKVTPEEFADLRREASEFLDAVQNLAGFSEARAQLIPPPAALALPMWSIRRLLTDPVGGLPSELTKNIPGTGLPGTGVLDRSGVGASPQDVPEKPRPEYADLEQLEAYVGRVSRFADRFLLRTQWGARAVHEALRTDARIRLPRPAPEQWIQISPGPPSKIKDALMQLAPKRELKTGGRPETWAHAVAGVEARLAGKPAARRYALARAKQWLDAAVNRKIAGPRDPVDPLEPSDDPMYDQKVEGRIRRRALRMRGMPPLAACTLPSLSGLHPGYPPSLGLKGAGQDPCQFIS